ncbi:CopG protein [Variovorax sp. WDL1]|nr:CopG protein [Variovorax sp. WDL1]
MQVTESPDTSSLRKRFGMPERLAGCHTATLEGYVLEGHVPAADIKRLLAMKPQALGLAVPGMPVGSPGMEYGDRRDPYKVLLVDRTGRERVFASYPG